MIVFTKRNLKVFFRDKSGVFFSLLAVLIVILLYVLFLSDMWMGNVHYIKDASPLLHSWIVASMLSVTSITTIMCALQIMVEDNTKNTRKDFYCSPVSRKEIVAGYILSGFIIGIVVSFIALIILEIYMVLNHESILSVWNFIQVLGIIMISNLASTSFIFFIISFFKSFNAYSIATTLIGIFIGFITGTYLPICQLPKVVQSFVKFFPLSHSASLFREVIMKKSIDATLVGESANYLSQFKQDYGVCYVLAGHKCSSLVSIIILILSAILFYFLGILNVSLQEKK